MTTSSRAGRKVWNHIFLGLAGILLLSSTLLGAGIASIASIAHDNRERTIPGIEPSNRLAPELLAALQEKAENEDPQVRVRVEDINLKTNDQKNFRDHMARVGNVRGWLIPGFGRTIVIIAPAEDNQIIVDMAKDPVQFATTVAPNIEPPKGNSTGLVVFETNFAADSRTVANIVLTVLGAVGAIVTILLITTQIAEEGIKGIRPRITP